MQIIKFLAFVSGIDISVPCTSYEDASQLGNAFRRMFPYHTWHVEVSMEINGVVITESMEEAVAWLIKNSRKITAIKLIREITRCGLKEGKDYVDSIQDKILASE